jgi:hypothetical protein
MLQRYFRINDAKLSLYLFTIATIRQKNYHLHILHAFPLGSRNIVDTAGNNTVDNTIMAFRNPLKMPYFQLCAPFLKKNIQY